MNVRTAENLLSCHREGVRPDASVQKALKMAESDELMREKLKANAVFDTQIVDAIHCVRPPDSLRKKIAECAGPKETAETRPASRDTVRDCGSVARDGFLVHLEMERRTGFPGKENAQRMLDQLNRMTGVELEIKSGTVGGLADWFMLRGFDEMTLPPDVASLPASGARTFLSAGHPVGQVAIVDGKHASILDVFRASDFGIELEEGGDWRVFAHGEWAAAIRQRGGVCTMLAFRGTVDEMKAFLLTLKP